jgi:hypothetical protein
VKVQLPERRRIAQQGLGSRSTPRGSPGCSRSRATRSGRTSLSRTICRAAELNQFRHSVAGRHAHRQALEGPALLHRRGVLTDVWMSASGADRRYVLVNGNVGWERKSLSVDLSATNIRQRAAACSATSAGRSARRRGGSSSATETCPRPRPDLLSTRSRTPSTAPADTQPQAPEGFRPLPHPRQRDSRHSTWQVYPTRTKRPPAVGAPVSVIESLRHSARAGHRESALTAPSSSAGSGLCFSSRRWLAFTGPELPVAHAHAATGSRANRSRGARGSR